ncbi:MAG: DUF4384 domain-containing protein [Nitrospirota bacterium]
MKQIFCRKVTYYQLRNMLILLTSALFLLSCAAADPRNVDVQLKETAPEVKITSFSEALDDLGLMTEIYASGQLKIQSNPIGDNTGTSMSTGGEIPRDITEMMKSSLNSIGGNIVYIPYDPAFIQNQMVTGYSGFENKLIPDVILSGGITEFDRGLETRGENTDASLGTEIKGVPDWLPSKNVGLKYGGADKAGLARITLDFNLLDFQTMSGISKMNTVNTMEVRKAVAGKELGISLFGQTFGLKGSIKKVQGRHAAVRLLVELSMIQIVGKHLVIPYWNLLGEDALPDKVVMAALAKYYYSLNDATAVASVQEWLYLYGYDVPQDGVLDASTQQALSELNQSFDAAAGKVGMDTFRNVYINIPITQQALGRRNMLARLYETQAQEEVAAAEAPAVEAYQEQQPVEQVQAAEVEAAPQEVAPAPKKTVKKRKGIGRILSDDEW